MPQSGEYDLFVEPTNSDTKTLIEENHNRLRFANKVSYADQYVGNGMTYDDKGRYNCGRCNQVQGGACLWVDIPSVDLEAGSCKDFENICAGDPELVLNRVSPDQAVYGVAKNGVGFGCHRCPYASKSKRGPDSLGRDLWCGYGAFRVFPNACCALNGAPTTKTTPKKESTEAYRKKALEAIQ